jgi:small subunit ribosomal protein S7e
MLEDIVLPAEIVGKRVRYRIDGSKIMKVTPLQPYNHEITSFRLSFLLGVVYRKLQQAII